MRHLGCALVALLAVTNAFAQKEVPVLRYDPPPNFYRSAIHPPFGAAQRADPVRDF